MLASDGRLGRYIHMIICIYLSTRKRKKSMKSVDNNPINRKYRNRQLSRLDWIGIPVAICLMNNDGS